MHEWLKVKTKEFHALIEVLHGEVRLAKLINWSDIELARHKGIFFR